MRSDLRPSDGLTLRWLGVAGVELQVGDKVLLVDPFLTRPPFLSLFIGRPAPNETLLSDRLPRCDYILVTHPHWDHLMDVPSVALRTGATVVGSSNTCQIAAACGVPAMQIKQVDVGDRFALGPFECEVLPADHGRTPIDWLINGRAAAGLKPPLRLRDYRMDVCFSFAVGASGFKILLMPTSGPPADIAVVGAAQSPARLLELFAQARPRLVVPVHWDAMFLPITRPPRPMLAPPSLSWPPLRRMHPERFQALVGRLAPSAQVLLPEPFVPYRLESLLEDDRSELDPCPRQTSSCDIPARATVQDSASHLLKIQASDGQARIADDRVTASGEGRLTAKDV